MNCVGPTARSHSASPSYLPPSVSGIAANAPAPLSTGPRIGSSVSPAALTYPPRAWFDSMRPMLAISAQSMWQPGCSLFRMSAAFLYALSMLAGMPSGPEMPAEPAVPARHDQRHRHGRLRQAAVDRDRRHDDVRLLQRRGLTRQQRVPGVRHDDRRGQAARGQRGQHDERATGERGGGPANGTRALATWPVLRHGRPRFPRSSLIALTRSAPPPVLAGRSKLSDGSKLWRMAQRNPAATEKFVLLAQNLRRESVTFTRI